MGYTTPDTVTGSSVLTAALWNSQVRDNFEAVAKQHTVRATRSGAQTTTSPPVYVDWNGTDAWDTSSMHNPASSSTDVVIPESGIYFASTTVEVRAGTTSAAYMSAFIQRFNSGGTLLATLDAMQLRVADTSPFILNVASVFQASATDRMKVLVGCTAGGTTSINPIEGVTNFTVSLLTRI